jgi:hypothetical protein
LSGGYFSHRKHLSQKDTCMASPQKPPPIITALLSLFSASPDSKGVAGMREAADKKKLEQDALAALAAEQKGG